MPKEVHPITVEQPVSWDPILGPWFEKWIMGGK